MAIIADLADDGGAHLQAGKAGADVPGEAADVADEASLMAQRGAQLGGIDVGAEAAHHDHLRRGHVFFQSISHS